MNHDGTIGYSTSTRGDPCVKGGGGWTCPAGCTEPRHGRQQRAEPEQPCGHPASSRRLQPGDGHTRCRECRAAQRIVYNAERRERNARRCKRDHDAGWYANGDCRECHRTSNRESARRTRTA